MSLLGLYVLEGGVARSPLVAAAGGQTPGNDRRQARPLTPNARSCHEPRFVVMREWFEKASAQPRLVV